MEKNFFQKYKIWIIVSAVALVIIFSSTLFSGVNRQVTLNVWGADFTSEQFDVLSRNIKAISRTPVKFVYKEIKAENYEKELTDSFIHSESPDIFLMNNTQIGKFKKLVYPFDLNQKNYNITNLKKEYPTIIEEEAVINNGLYMLPISIDSLALYYNRNIFDSLSIPTPPKTWSDVLKLIPSLRQLDAYNRISRSPIGMGLGESIKNSSDIFALNIMQINGKIIDNKEQRVMLNERVRIDNNYIDAGEEALKFYSQFSLPNNQSYSWNSSFGSDLDAFANNKLAIYIGYRGDKEAILKKNPNLNFGIAEMPQRNINNNINFGKFFGFTVSSQSKNKEIAWEALYSLMNPENINSLISFSKLPPANRTLINEYYNDAELSIFAKQALSSKSFYHPDPRQVSVLLRNTLDQVNIDQNYRDAIQRLNQNLINLMYNH